MRTTAAAALGALLLAGDVLAGHLHPGDVHDADVRRRARNMERRARRRLAHARRQDADGGPSMPAKLIQRAYAECPAETTVVSTLTVTDFSYAVGPTSTSTLCSETIFTATASPSRATTITSGTTRLFSDGQTWTMDSMTISEPEYSTVPTQTAYATVTTTVTSSIPTPLVRSTFDCTALATSYDRTVTVSDGRIFEAYSVTTTTSTATAVQTACPVPDARRRR